MSVRGSRASHSQRCRPGEACGRAWGLGGMSANITPGTKQKGSKGDASAGRKSGNSSSHLRSGSSIYCNRPGGFRGNQEEGVLSWGLGIAIDLPLGRPSREPD